MGFAGQVFAARVAVGLALPSPKAFSQAGQMIGGFASKMYQNLNQKNVKAAQQSLGNAQRNLAAARGRLEKHGQQSDKFLEKSAKQAVNRLSSAYAKLGKTAMASAGAMKGLKKSLGKPIRQKLFSNVGKDLGDAKTYTKIFKNFTKLQKEERKEVMLGIEATKLMLQNKLSTAKKEKKVGKEGLDLIRQEIEYNDLKLKEFQYYDKNRNIADDKYNKKKKKYTDQERKATQDVTRAQRELIQTEKEQLQVQKMLISSANNFVVTMKTNFVEAVRESISVLTAFYYKINQNTQELISFERELLNANSVFRVTNDELFSVGDQVVQFGQAFGLEMQNGAEGLYQLASAGLSAAESAQVLTETLKLAMAVQGDHNTISKLVTQTLFGFEMEMNQAAEITDKFAFAIQKSLIEYQDLASAVKFALPFFTSTGQSIDQLLGALQVLTNRALEAGIAGRGLRQGVAELAESIGDSTANFKKMGVEVTDAQGNMLQLTEIAANFSKVLEDGVINDTELLTTLIQDLNVRGATAFVHLVQASDEFTEAVEATANAGGELDEMVKIQNESMMAQIQILRNNIGMMFLYRDANYEGTGFLNAFHEAIVTTIQSLQNLVVVQKDGAYELTQFGLAIQTIAINGVNEMRGVLNNIVPIFERFVEISAFSIQVLKVYMIPLKMIIKALDIMGPTLTKVVLSFHLLSKVLPITAIAQWAYFTATTASTKATAANITAQTASTLTTRGYTAALITLLAWQKLKTAALYLGALGYWNMNAAETYSMGLKTLGISLTATEQKQMTRTIFLRHLETAGIAVEASAIAGLEAKQTVAIATREVSIFTLMKETFVRWKHTVAEWAGVAVGEVGLALMLKRIIYYPIELFWKLRNYIVDKMQTVMDSIRISITGAYVAVKLLMVNVIAAETGVNYGLAFAENNRLKSTIGLFLISVKNLAMKKLTLIWDTLLLNLRWLWLIASGQTQRALAMEGVGRDKLFVMKVRDYLISIKNWLLDVKSAIWRMTTGVVSYLAIAAANTLSNIAEGISNMVRTVGLTVMAAENAGKTRKIAITIAATAWLLGEVIVVGLYNIIMGISTVITWLMTTSLWAMAVAVIAATWPFVLIGLAVLIVVGTFVALYRIIDETIGLTMIFTMFFTHLKLAIVDLAMWIISPFVALGQAMGDVMEGPLFKFLLFMSHLFLMLQYYFGEIKTWFVDNLITPIMTVLGTLYNDYLLPYLIQPLIDIANRIVEIVKNPLKALGELKDWLADIGAAMWDGLVAGVQKVIDVIMKLIGWLVSPGSTWGDLFGAMMDAAKKPIEAIVKFIGGLIDKIKGLFDLVGKAADLAKGGVDIVKGAAKATVETGKAMVDTTVENTKMAASIIGEKTGISDASHQAQKTVGNIVDKLPIPKVKIPKVKLWGEGGMVQGYAEGGWLKEVAGKLPYIVGEKGPELFMPKGGGKIFPKKDLNTSRVQDMLGKALDEGRARGRTRGRTMQVDSLTVGKLDAGESNLSKAKVGIDPFGGIPKLQGMIGGQKKKAAAMADRLGGMF